MHKSTVNTSTNPHTGKYLSPSRYQQHNAGPSIQNKIQKFDSLSPSDKSPRLPPPLPPPPRLTSVPKYLNNKHKNGTNSPSSSSLSESIYEEYPAHTNGVDQRRLPVERKKHQVATTPPTIIRPKHSQHSEQNVKSTSPVPARHYRKGMQDAAAQTDIGEDDYEEELLENSSNHLNRSSTSSEQEHDQSQAVRPHASSVIIYQRLQTPEPTNNGIRNDRHRKKDMVSCFRTMPNDLDDVGLEVAEPTVIRRPFHEEEEAGVPSMIEHYGDNIDVQQHHQQMYPQSYIPPRPPPPAFALPYSNQTTTERTTTPPKQKSVLPSICSILIGSLLVVFILSMVLVVAIKRDQEELRAVMQIVYSYIYTVGIAWMIWCIFDIIKFRRKWLELTNSASDHEEYMEVAARHPNETFYFPDVQNTGGLFMRIGAGLLCMGSLLFTVVELGQVIETIRTNQTHSVLLPDAPTLTVAIAHTITYILRFLFHCVQFTFLFRYGNLVIDRYHIIAKVGLIHLVIGNFCTWFEAIVNETVEQWDHYSDDHPLEHTSWSSTSTTTALFTTAVNASDNSTSIIRAAMSDTGATFRNATVLEYLTELEKDMGEYLYPCLIEYSLISVTVFYIMWQNVGARHKKSFLRFSDRHVFMINCSRASRGLLIGGIILVLTILTLIPSYLLAPDTAVQLMQMTELILICVAIIIVLLAFRLTVSLYSDPHAHIDKFDEVLIYITTFGAFAYGFFTVLASTFYKSDEQNETRRRLELAVGFLGIFQTVIQSSFILDTLRRRSTSKDDFRNKPGRDMVTALLLINLAIWMHDSLEAKKVKVNLVEIEYFGRQPWALIQAFTSPLAIFYRFHSSVCLADIWQVVYQERHSNDRGNAWGEKNVAQPFSNINGGHEAHH